MSSTLSRRKLAWAFAAFAALAVPASAQQYEGVYTLRGSEPTRGAYTGRLEMRWHGNGFYAFTRVVDYTTFRFRNRPVSTVWTGWAREVAGGVDVLLSLDRHGWISAAVGSAVTRTAADGTPMAVTGPFRINPSGLWNGIWRGQGPRFVDRSETWTRQGSTGPQPIWSSERQVVPAHRPSSWFKRFAFALFNTFHTQPAWVTPHVNRPEFQAAVHSFVFDKTDFAYHRANPTHLRVINKLVDDLTLIEAVAKADAFGTPLRDKATAADAEVQNLFIDPSGALALRAGNSLVGDYDGVLWTGVYGYSQALRLQATGDPVARANAEGVVRAILTHMEVAGSDADFARTIRAATGNLGGGWRRGVAPHTNVEWRTGGNNDMWKGLVWGGLIAHEVLAPNDPLRARFGRRLSSLTHNNPVGDKGRLGVKNNQLMGTGLASLLTGDRSDRRTYERQARNPFGMLYQLALGGGFYYQGISDWSGNHLEISSLIIQLRLARHHNERISRLVLRLAMRRAARRFAPTRRPLHIIAAAGMADIRFFRGIDGTDGVWSLREVPYPRVRHVGIDHGLRDDYVASPYPTLPWKNDWVTNRGRSRSLVAPPLFERSLTNYEWKNSPVVTSQRGGINSTHYNSADILIAYWLGRAYGVIGPND